MLRACAFAVSLLAPTADAAAISDLAAPADDPAAAQLRQASLHHAARRYPAAAAIYEALYEASPEPALLLAAARSRLAAGHHAHAVAYFSRLVASGRLTAADTQVVYAELQAAQRGVTPVTVRVQLPDPLAAAAPTLTAHYVPRSGEEPRAALALPVPPGAGPVRVVMLQLDPGTWRIQFAGHTLALVDVLAHPGPALQLDLRRSMTAETWPSPQRQRLAGVVAGLGGALLGVGLGLTVRGQLTQVQPILARPRHACPDPRTCRDPLARAIMGRSLGAGLLGAGAGLLVSGLTALAHDPRARRSAWIAELALGGAGVLGSSVALALAARGFNHDPASDRPWGDPHDLDATARHTQRHTIAAAGLGLGAGLLFGSVVGLVRAKLPRRHPRRTALQRPLGLAVLGEF